MKNIYRYGSEGFFNLINETRELYKKGEIDLCLADKELLPNHIGEKGMFEGKEVWLDIPMETHRSIIWRTVSLKVKSLVPQLEILLWL